MMEDLHRPKNAPSVLHGIPLSQIRSGLQYPVISFMIGNLVMFIDTKVSYLDIIVRG